MVYGKGNSNGMETRVIHSNKMTTLLKAMLIARVPMDSNTIEVMIMRTGYPSMAARGRKWFCAGISFRYCSIPLWPTVGLDIDGSWRLSVER